VDLPSLVCLCSFVCAVAQSFVTPESEQFATFFARCHFSSFAVTVRILVGFMCPISALPTDTGAPYPYFHLLSTSLIIHFFSRFLLFPWHCSSLLA